MDGEKAYKNYGYLSPQCKDMFIYGLFLGFDVMSIAQKDDFEFPMCKSPIEKYFKFAYEILNVINNKKLEGIELIAQKEINIGNKTYYADFVMEQTKKFERDFKLIIECDGHEYHSTKEQIQRDNLRDLDLKTAGYDVLHFSGSQLYNDPLVCVMKSYQYFIKMSGKLKRRAKNGKCKE